MKITKAIIAAAGYGTRFLPATKNVQKEMLPILDKPVIHYLVQELVDSGIEEIIIIKRDIYSNIEEYFKPSPKLEDTLKKSGKDDLLKQIQEIPSMAKVSFVNQDDSLPYGNGSPILFGQKFLETDEPFVYMFGDDLVISEEPATKQLIKVFQDQEPTAVLAVQEVPWKEIHRYGSVRYKKDSGYKYEIDALLEKVPQEEAPSNVAQFGRFIFSYEVLEAATKQETGLNNELWMADILNNLAKSGSKIIAQPINGEWLTTGDPLRFLKTSIKYAVQNKDYKEELIKFLREEL